MNSPACMHRTYGTTHAPLSASKEEEGEGEEEGSAIEWLVHGIDGVILTYLGRVDLTYSTHY